MAWKNLSLRIRLGILMLSIFGGVGFAQPLFVSAGPITNGPGVAPFTKLGIYQGLLTIAPVRLCVGGSNPGTSCPNANECTGGGICTTSSILEIGNAGRDIAGSGELYIRPGSTDRSVALRLFKAANGRAEAFLSSGSLCLGSVSGTTCRSTWPSGGGAGDTYWEEYSVSPKLCVGGRYAGIACYDSSECVDGGVCTAQAAQTVLRPSAAATPSTIRIGRPNSPIPSTSGRAVEVYGNGSTVARIGGYLSSGLSSYDDLTGVTSFTGGDVSISGNLFFRNVTFSRGAYENGEFDIYPYSSVNKYSNYYPTYRERGTEGTIDADTFDSEANLPFASYYCRGGSNPGTSCANAGLTGPNPAACLGGGVCQKNDLVVIASDIPNSSAVLGHICLKTNNAKLCAGGTAASNAGTPCTDNTQCTNGAVCTSMCKPSLEICPNSPKPNTNDPVGGNRCDGGANYGQSCTTAGYSSPECPPCGGAGQPACPAAAKRCSFGGNQCTSNADCFGGGVCSFISAGSCSPYRCAVSGTTGSQPCRYASDCGSGTCLRGEIQTQSGYTNSFCSGMTCQEVCSFKTACSGDNPSAGVCNGYGDSVRYNNGSPLATTGSNCNSTGICQPGAIISGVCTAYIYALACDCYLDTPKEYYKSQPPSSEGLLCTDYFD